MAVASGQASPPRMSSFQGEVETPDNERWVSSLVHRIVSMQLCEEKKTCLLYTSDAAEKVAMNVVT